MNKFHAFSYRPMIAGALALLCSFHAYAETPDEFVALAEEAFNKADIVSAISYYRKAAEAGNIPAQLRLAFLLDHAEENQEAIKWYREAAAQGEAQAELGLARMYATGDGLEKNIEEARRLLTSSASKGFAPAINVIAKSIEKGELGFRPDYEQARAWLEKGIAQNDPASIERMAKAYANGELGLRIDRQKAKQLEQLLARLNQENDEQ